MISKESQGPRAIRPGSFTGRGGVAAGRPRNATLFRRQLLSNRIIEGQADRLLQQIVGGSDRIVDPVFREVLPGTVCQLL